MKNINVLFILVVMLIGTVSCKDKDPVIPEQPELITTLIYTLTPTNGGDPVEFSFSDPDGDGGTEPVIISAPLDSGFIYNAEILLLNESVNPAENISEEVLEESEEHQFFFLINQAKLDVVYNDNDDNGNPLGLKTVLGAGQMSEGQLTIILRHLPDKFANGVSEGNITNAGGETDIEVTFPVIIK